MIKENSTLAELKDNETAYIVTAGGSQSFRLRLEEMGFVPGQEVTRLYASPLGNPIVYAMLGQKVALRRLEAEKIRVSPVPVPVSQEQPAPHPLFGGGENNADAARAAQCNPIHCEGCPGCGGRRSERRGQRRGWTQYDAAHKPLTIALVGNPNCGKTAFFNAASGGHERTGNYAGVTVSSVVGHTVFEGHRLRVVDLPGTYSLRAFSPEEAFVANELQNGGVDVIINVLDVNNLERNLLLTFQLRQMGLPIVAALNLYDEFEQSGSLLDIPALEQRLGLRLLPTVARTGRGVEDVMRAAIGAAQQGEAPQEVEPSADPHAEIHACLDGIYRLKEGRTSKITALADRFLAKRATSYLAFLAIIWVVFYATFTLGQYPMDWMDAGIGWIGEQVEALMSPGWLRDLVSSGIIGGVGSVIVFLPNILILYFLISILEDSGYLVRAALLVDPLLRRVGLHGKSFFPMLTGFGCNVPAVMATRTIESRKSRLITMMTLPFMSCSARLPVYVIFSAAFFPQHAVAVMFSLYVIGICVAFLSAWILGRFVRRTEQSHFVMEVPPYRMPVLSSVLHHTWDKGRQYLHKMGGIILVASVIVWALGYFPQGGEELSAAEQQEQSYLGRLGHAIEPAISPLGYDWRMGVGILSGLGAKELMVSTLGVLYNIPEDEAASAGSGEDPDADHALVSALRDATTPPAALSYLVFALLYFPCLATIAAIKGESGRWRYATFTAAYTTAVAYVTAFIAYHGALLWL